MLNHITIMGRLVKDPELRYTQSNIPVASFRIACDRDFGEKQTDFLDCTAWRATANFVSKYFHKGDLITIEGRLQVRDYEDRDGNKRRAFEIVTDRAYFCGGKKKDSAETDTVAKNEFEDMDDDGELPFDMDDDDDQLPL